MGDLTHWHDDDGAGDVHRLGGPQAKGQGHGRGLVGASPARSSTPEQTGTWYPGDRWLVPAAGAFPEPGTRRGPVPFAGAGGTILARYTMTYLTRPDEGSDRPEPCLLLAPVDAGEAARTLGKAYSGVVLADPRDLAGLLEQRPDLHRPRGGRPCWVLLAWDETANPAGWARGWARVMAWVPAALPPVLVPRCVLPDRGRDDAPLAVLGGAPFLRSGDAPCAGTSPAPFPGPQRALLAGLGRARQELLRLLEEPVPMAVVLPAAWRPALRSEAMPAGLEEAPVWWLVPPR